jgi:hypothetical protein
MKPLLVGGALVLVWLHVNEVQAQSPSVEELIPRATAYAHDFIDRFSNVVAEERYEQQIASPKRKRTLVSDFLLVRYPGDTLWQSFRDVAEVDGKPVRDREDRMMKLFLEPSSDALRRARELAAASSRHNLVDIGTLNNPLLVLAFLQPQYVDRFRFNLAGIEKKLGPDVRTVRFVEFRVPSLLKGNSNSDIMSRGLMWIEQGTGRVVKTELQLGSTMVPVRISTLYKFDDELGINVPTEMEDVYPNTPSGEFRGKATYGKFRRFEVKTEETIEKP